MNPTTSSKTSVSELTEPANLIETGLGLVQPPVALGAAETHSLTVPLGAGEAQSWAEPVRLSSTLTDSAQDRNSPVRTLAARTQG